MLVGEREREQQVVAEVSADELMKHTATIAAEERLSGNEAEAKAVGYFKQLMEDWGYDTKIQWIENYISLPIKGALTVLSPESRDVSCITHSFSVTTPPGGLEAELVYLPEGSNLDVRGRIVVQDGLALPATVYGTEQRGAAGQLFVNASDLPRNMIVSTIWGQPVPESAGRIPKTPVVSMNQENGEYLKALCAKGPVKVRLETETWTGFKKVPLAIADVKGKVEPDKFVMFNGHLDSWHEGASDNATANACMLETARVLAKHRDELKRGVRFIWWSGHSHGRYSGSNWYADYNWEDLDRNAVVNLNVDSLGCVGATDYSEVECSAELYDLGREVIEKYTGQRPNYQRIGRSGDQSFWGIGLPALYQLLSRAPKGEGAGVFISGLSWFWHTAADTMDKIDRDILLKDTQIYMATLWRLCTAPVLPMSYVPVAEEFARLLSGLQEKAGDAFDLMPAIESAELLKSRAAELRRAAEQASAGPGSDRAMALNECIVKLGRILMPAGYSAVDRFETDLAIPIPPLPRLQPVAQMAGMDRESNEYRFLERKMVRERTRVLHALNEATELIEKSLKTLEG